jgi:DNA-binding NarL/FixJ family response regulator
VIEVADARHAGPGGAVRPVSVVVIASDPITAEAAIACLWSEPGIVPLAPDGLPRAGVVLMLAALVTKDTIDAIRRVASSSNGRDVRFVLVSGGVTAPKLVRVISCGLVSLIPRQEADHARIVQAIRAVRSARAELPGIALNTLGGVAAGLDSRELDVLRLLADGLDTNEIAQRLSYSERTVKNIIQGLLSRLHLRNRPHAVAFALRNGLL